MLPRIYDHLIREHFEENKEMLFLMGPRQVGKTTSGLRSRDNPKNIFYFNWDNLEDRSLILSGQKAVIEEVHLEIAREKPPTLIFDEIHKYKEWKTFLKGFYDSYNTKVNILVTGSARLDVFRKGGDSLMGRYLLYRLHPFSVGELVFPSLPAEDLITPPQKISNEKFDSIWKFGGFPAPLTKKNQRYYNRWKSLRHKQLFQEDLRDLSRLQDLSQIEFLAELIKAQCGQLTSYTSLAKKIRVSVDTIRRWIEILKSTYYCFSLSPWSKNISRSLLKEPKYFLWDWSLLDDEGARLENLIASHLLKATHLWTDYGFGDFALYFLRTKEKREVDFLVSKEGKPWFIVEVKKSPNKPLSPQLDYFQKMTQAEHAFQVTLNKDYININCFEEHKPIIVPIKTFLSQLP